MVEKRYTSPQKPYAPTKYCGATYVFAGKPDGTPRKLLKVSNLPGPGTPKIDLRTGIEQAYQQYLANNQADLSTIPSNSSRLACINCGSPLLSTFRRTTGSVFEARTAAAVIVRFSGNSGFGTPCGKWPSVSCCIRVKDNGKRASNSSNYLAGTAVTTISGQ